MDSTNSTGFLSTNSQNQNSDPGQQPPSKEKKQSKFIRNSVLFIKRYWFIVLAILLIVGALVTWFVVKSNQDAAWDRATSYFAKADYKKAEKELSGLGIPSDKERLRVYAQTMLATQHLEESLTAYRKLYDINKDVSAKLIIGNIYNQKKEYDEAIKIYKEIIASNPNSVQAYVNLATVYKLQGKDTEAISIAKGGVAKNPSSVVLNELLVSMLMNDTGSSEYKSAVATLKKLDPANPLLQALNQ